MPSYMFLFSTDNRQFIKFEVADPPLQFKFEINGISVKASLYLYGSPSFNVLAEYEGTGIDLGNLADVLIHTMYGVYDSAGLAMGIAHTLRLEGICEVGKKFHGGFTYALPKFEGQIQAAGLTFQDWVNLSVGSPHIRAGLRDIRLAMETPDEVAVHCYRAIERIRQTFVIGNNRKDSWAALATGLNVERSWLDSYTAHATAVRHGELVILTVAERDKCLTQAATVLIRFTAYLKAGKTALSAPSFPLLS